MKPPHTAALDAISRSASARTIIASLPPNSRTDGISLRAHASAIFRPVSTLPVKNTLSGAASISALPISPPPCTICTRCSGKLARAAISPISAPVHGVSSLGFSTHGIASGQRRNHLRHRNREGIIPRRDDCDDSERLVFEPAGFRFRGDVVVRDALGTQPLRRAAREKIGRVERENDFGEDGFDARLARLARDHVGDFVAAVEDRVAQPTQRRGALADRLRRPCCLRGPRALENRGHVAGLARFESRDCSPGRWIDRLDVLRRRQQWCRQVSWRAVPIIVP